MKPVYKENIDLGKGIKHPKFTRADSRGCKLTNADIDVIRREFSNGVPVYVLAKRFNVHSCSIKYWVDDKEREKRNEKSRKTRHLYKRFTKEEHAKAALERYHRRKKLYVGKVELWESYTGRKRRKICPEVRENNRIACREYYQKNPHIWEKYRARPEVREKMSIACKKYYQKNKHKWKEYNKRYKRRKLEDSIPTA